MKRIWTGLFLGLLVSLLACGSVWAQATAQISGVVQDSTGAVLPGVEVTATQTDTGISRMTVSNETGAYVLPNLPVGPYRLEAGLPGFRTFVQTGIVLQVNANPTIVPAWLMPFASADGRPGSVPRRVSWLSALQLTAVDPLLVSYQPAQTPASLIALA
jgi:hypothetical protein